MKPLLRRCLLLAMALLPLPALAQAPSKLDTIIAQGKLRVGIPGDYNPFALRDPASNTLTGMDIDMAEALAAAMGVKLEFVASKWGDLLADIAADKFDIGMGGISINLARQKAAFFSTPVLRTGKAAIARCDAKAKFASLADIDRPGVKVITNPGGTNERFDRATLKNAEIVLFPNNTGVWDEILARRVDLMITDNIETRIQQKLHPELCAINPDQPFDFGELGYLLPRDVALKMWVDQFLHIAAQTGELARLSAKWLN